MSAGPSIRRYFLSCSTRGPRDSDPFPESSFSPRICFGPQGFHHEEPPGVRRPCRVGDLGGCRRRRCRRRMQALASRKAAAVASQAAAAAEKARAAAAEADAVAASASEATADAASAQAAATNLGLVGGMVRSLNRALAEALGPAAAPAAGAVGPAARGRAPEGQEARAVVLLPVRRCGVA
ncbi:unnamed protein product [Prorocentrum cordatum]|uniref:Uncharacterized protein n=1 Tax=Prorocentrum cordatum TaxID=2364126 RepID=A0ABN9PTD9_9DINO|nr:unnamed protein product [Polarella glacialis]